MFERQSLHRYVVTSVKQLRPFCVTFYKLHGHNLIQQLIRHVSHMHDDGAKREITRGRPTCNMFAILHLTSGFATEICYLKCYSSFLKFNKFHLHNYIAHKQFTSFKNEK